MEPTTLDIVRTGDLGGEKIAMGFDESSIGHIMNVLTDLYSDPEQAVLREYSTNARDAHIAAGIPNRPIEVSTPNLMSPYFTVKDFGTGLSVKDIEEIYSKYGASTKRGGNDQVGMLGLGCKSGLTYTSQFQVTACKDGRKAVVTVSRMEDGRGVMEVVHEGPTSEPNSVEVQVPAKKGNTFINKATNFFRFWEPGTVLLNGKQPEKIKGETISPNVLLVDSLGKDYIVMGGVAYPVSDGLAGNSSYRTWGVVATVGIGEINFTPSREDLHYTGRTKATIERVRKEFSDNITRVMNAEIATAANYGQAIDKYIAWTARLGATVTAGAKYKGYNVETRWAMPTHPVKDAFGRTTQASDYYITYRVPRYTGARGSVGKHNSTLTWEQTKSAFFITDYPFDDLPSARREKIKYYMDTNGITAEVIMCFPGKPPGSPWTDSVSRTDYASVKALKVPRTSVRTASGYRFEVVDSNGHFADTNTLDDSIEIVYFSPADYNSYNIASAIGPISANVQMVKLGRNRWDKFKRDFPTAQYITDWMKGRLNSATNALGETDKCQIWMDSSSRRNHFSKFDETKIDDPAVKRMIAISKATSKSTAHKNYLSACELKRAVLHQYAPEIQVTNPLDEYPLVSNAGYSRGNIEDAIIYINAKYALTKAASTAKV